MSKDKLFEFVIVILIAYFFSYVFGFTGMDDTDSTVSRERSGMSMYIDHGTGCQYLRKGLFSPLVPRMGADGRQVCRRNK